MDLPPDTPRYRRWDDEPPVYGNASPLRRLLSFPFSVSVAAPGRRRRWHRRKHYRRRFLLESNMYLLGISMCSSSIYLALSMTLFLFFLCLYRRPTAAVVVGIVGSITGDDFLWNRPCT
jgi:hypothetical protein